MTGSHDGWTKVPFWSLFRRDKRTDFPDEELLSVYRDYGVIRKADRDDNWNRPGENMSSYQLVEPGDLVLNKMKTWQGSLGISPHRGIVSPAYFVYRPGSDNDSRFLHHALRSQFYIDQYAQISKGVRIGQWDLQPEKLDAMLVLLPPRRVQRRLADFLDRETAEIDAMDAELNHLIQTLRLRNNACIREAMTPESGQFTRIKYTADVSLGKTFQGAQKRTGERFVNYVRAASIQPHGLALDDQRMWMTVDELDRYRLLRDDVLIVEGGAGYGRSVALKEDMPGWGFQNHVIRVRPSAGWDGSFLNWAVRAQFANGLIDIMVDGATIPALSSDKARELPVLHVPRDEQQRIAAKLDEQTARIDDMIADANHLKNLLAERRSTLITEVVTGRKKVPA